MNEERLSSEELHEIWDVLSPDERLEAFLLLERGMADSFFLELSTTDQIRLLGTMTAGEQRLWLRILPPDDAADLLQDLEEPKRTQMLEMFDDITRQEVVALMAYAEDAAGGLMSPRFARLRPEMTVGEAIRYLRKQASEKLETIYDAYVLEQDQRLRGAVTFRDLFTAKETAALSSVMKTDIISVPDTLDQEAVAEIMARHDLNVVPVVAADGTMKGIVTIDDIVQRGPA
ncbi:MAG: CBS domain-containing protein [Polyangiaceae bacterium]